MSVKQGTDTHIKDFSSFFNALNFSDNFRVFVVILRVFLVILIIASISLMPSVAHSHKVNIFAYAEEDKIFTESYFNDGSPCKDSMIQVFDPDGNELLQGRTDKEGNFSFKVPDNVPKKTDLRIVLTASMGHKAEYTLPASELPSKIESSALSEEAKKIESSPLSEPSPLSTKIEPSPFSHEGKPGEIADQNNIGDNSIQPDVAVDPDQIRSIVEDAVDRSIEKRMKPLMNSMINSMVKAQTTRVAFRDIIGGIGYIFGVMGIILYFKKREN